MADEVETLVDDSTKYKILYEVWFFAYEKAIRDVLGANPKIVSMRAYENAVRHFLFKIASERYGIEVPKFSRADEALSWYIELLRKFGILPPTGEPVRFSSADSELVVEVANCPYLDICLDLVREGVELRHLTCPRIGCFRAAVAILTGGNYEYRLTEVSLSGGCRGVIRPVTG